MLRQRYIVFTLRVQRKSITDFFEKENQIGYANKHVSWFDVPSIHPIKRRARHGFGTTTREEDA